MKLPRGENENKKQPRDFSWLEGKTKDELLEEMDDYIGTASELEFDNQLMRAYLQQLEKIDPLPKDLDAKASWEQFVQRNPELFADDAPAAEEPAADIATTAPLRRRRSRSPLRMVVACLLAVVLLIGVNAAVATASGFNLFGRMLTWTSEVLHISGGASSGRLTLPTDADAEYLSLRQALDANGFEDVACPTWIPEDFALSTLEVSAGDIFFGLVAEYVSDDGRHFYFDMTYSSSPTAQGSHEYDGEYDVYKRKGIEYHFMTNSGTPVVLWFDDDLRYTLSGDLNDWELKKIINTIK